MAVLNIHGIIDFKAKDKEKYFTPDMLTQFISDNAAMTELTIDVDSIGGHVEAGRRIYNDLQGLRATGVIINSHSSGKVMSIATIIYLVGEKRTANEKSFSGLIHLPFVNGSDLKNETLNSNELAAMADSIKQLETDICERYAYHTDKDAGFFHDIMQEEKIMNANEFKEIGIVTDVIKEEVEAVENKNIMAYAYFDETKFNNKVDMTQVEVKNELSGMSKILLDIKNFLRVSVKNMVKADVSGVDVDFAGAQNEAEIVEGLEGVTVDGKPATGEFTFSDFKVTIENGTVTKRETTEEAATDDASALKEENDELKKEIENLKAENASVQNSFDKFKADADVKFNEYFAKFDAFQNKFPDVKIQNLGGSPEKNETNDQPLFVKKIK